MSTLINKDRAMKLSIKAMALVSALTWGGEILILGLVHPASPVNATGFLQGMVWVYPGFHGGQNLGDAASGGLYALDSGACAGPVFAWLYNWVAAQSHKS